MPFDLGDPAAEAGRSRWWATGLVALLALLAGGTWWFLRSDTTGLPAAPVADSPDAVAEAPTRADAADELLGRLGEELVRDGPATLERLAAPGDEARAELRDLRHNARLLDLRDLSLRYVDAHAADVAGVPRRLREDAWVANVAVSWRVAGDAPRPSTLEVTATLVDEGAGAHRRARLVSLRRDLGRPAPLWMLDRLVARPGPRSLVIAAERDRLGSYDVAARRAVREVTGVLPRWRGRLVVEVPRSQAQLERVLAAGDTDFGAIAAITSPVDGSGERGAATHVFLNPTVFEPLADQGAQIVMSHEATHVATAAAVSAAPAWVLEGFADYVALVDVDLPEQVMASQILQQVRRRGAPERLPGDASFSSTSTHLGASYEAAWLASRLLAREYGERRLLRFYDQADRTGDTDRAFGEVLSVTERGFVRQWRAYLERLAG